MGKIRELGWYEVSNKVLTHGEALLVSEDDWGELGQVPFQHGINSRVHAEQSG